MDTLAYFHLASAYETPIAENAFDRKNTSESSESSTTKQHSSVFWMRFLSVAVILATLSTASSAMASYHHGCKVVKKYDCGYKVVKVKHHYPKKCHVAKIKHHHKHYSGVGKGSSGRKVAKIQRKLRHLGYFDAKVTGYFGPITKHAVIDFQKDYGIKPTGFVGPVTKKALGL